MSTAPVYTRSNTDWSAWLDLTGKVVVVTTVRVAPPAQHLFTPYDLVMVQFKRPRAKRKIFMAASGESIQPGDTVKCVLRRLGVPDATSLINYGIKVAKVTKVAKV